MAVDNARIAALITRYADLLEIDGANPFRIRAYRSVVRYLRGPAPAMAGLVAAGRDLTELPGIGRILADKITTIVATGDLPQLRELETRLPGGLADLMALPGLGAGHVRTLYRELGVSDPTMLRSALADGRVAQLSGFGPKLVARLQAAVAAAPDRNPQQPDGPGPAGTA